MLNNNYDLHNLLNSYSETLDKYSNIKSLNTQEKTDLIKEKDARAHKLMNVIIMGGEKLNPGQLQSLKTFHSIYKNKEDRVVQLVGQVLQSSPTFPTQKETIKLPNEIKSIVHTFKNTSELQELPEKTQSQIVDYAFSRLLDARTDRNEVHYASDLAQFTKILSMYWDRIPDKHQEIFGCVRDLIQINKIADIKADEFNDLAMILLDKKMASNDFQTIPYYHGELIKKGMEYNEQMLSYNSKVPNTPLIQFIEDYCKKRLNTNEYLLRPSSSAPSTDDADGVRYFPVTLTAKHRGKDYQQGDQLQHFRLTKRDDNGTITWQRGIPSESNFKHQNIYATLEDCIRGIQAVKNYTPCLLHKPFQPFIGTFNKWNL